MTDPAPDQPTPPAPSVKGFTCPDCRGVRLFVYRTRRPAAGRIVRYRQCSACGFRLVTEERVRPAPKAA